MWQDIQFAYMTYQREAMHSKDPSVCSLKIDKKQQ